MKNPVFGELKDFVRAGDPLLKDVSKTAPYKVAKKAFKNRGNGSKKFNNNNSYRKFMRNRKRKER